MFDYKLLTLLYNIFTKELRHMRLKEVGSTLSPNIYSILKNTFIFFKSFLMVLGTIENDVAKTLIFDHASF